MYMGRGNHCSRHLGHMTKKAVTPSVKNVKNLPRVHDNESWYAAFGP